MTPAPSQPGMLIIASGPSGAGKNTVFNEVIRRQQGRVQESVSCTTREPRPGEVEGKDYYFVPLEDFNRLERDGYFLEAAGQHDKRRYGTPLKPVLEKLSAGTDVLLVIEVNGAKVARRRMPDALTIFIMPAGDTLEEKAEQLERQILNRAEMSEALKAHRLEIATAEIEQAQEYQHVVINAPGELDRAVDEVIGIIERERERRQRLAAEAPLA